MQWWIYAKEEKKKMKRRASIAEQQEHHRKAAFGMLLIKDSTFFVLSSFSCLWHVWLLIINKSINAFAESLESRKRAGEPENRLMSQTIFIMLTTQHKKSRKQKLLLLLYSYIALRSCNCAFFSSSNGRGKEREETRDSKLPFSSCCRAQAKRQKKSLFFLLLPRARSPPLPPLPLVFIFIKANKKCAPSNIGETI